MVISGFFIKSKSVVTHLSYLGMVIMGSTTLIFHRRMSDDLIKAYPSTKASFIRFMNIAVGFAFVAGGLVGLMDL